MQQVKTFCIIVTAFSAMAAGMASAQAWKPTGNVEIGVASGAGGASDRSARLLQKLLL